MYERGTFVCAICDDRLHEDKKNSEFRSYFPERRILVCNYCLHDYRTDPEYAHLRPDVAPEDVEEIREKRKKNGNRRYF